MGHARPPAQVLYEEYIHLRQLKQVTSTQLRLSVLSALKCTQCLHALNDSAAAGGSKLSRQIPAEALAPASHTRHTDSHACIKRSPGETACMCGCWHCLRTTGVPPAMHKWQAALCLRMLTWTHMQTCTLPSSSLQSAASTSIYKPNWHRLRLDPAECRCQCMHATLAHGCTSMHGRCGRPP